MSTINIVDHCPVPMRAKLERMRPGQPVVIHAEANSTRICAVGVIDRVAADEVLVDVIRVPSRPRITHVTPGDDIGDVHGDLLSWGEMPQRLRAGDEVTIVETRGNLVTRTTGYVSGVSGAGFWVGARHVFRRDVGTRVYLHTEYHSAGR